MARLPRLVVPGYPHHVAQRGNRRRQVFFGDDDYGAYVGLLGKWCAKAGTDMWAYCLMPIHVHLVLVPAHKDGLRAARRAARRTGASGSVPLGGDAFFAKLAALPGRDVRPHRPAHERSP